MFRKFLEMLLLPQSNIRKASNQIPVLFPPALPAPPPNNTPLIQSSSHISFATKTKKDLVLACPQLMTLLLVLIQPDYLLLLLLVMIRLQWFGLGNGVAAASLSLFLRLKN